MNQDIDKILKNRKYEAGFHLMPPIGWINDPNGLCQLNGVHHIFFQYSPEDPKGANKYWGHYETCNFIDYEYTGIFLSPDEAIDRDGVYSGSALVEDDTMYLFYTGNVLQKGDFDYVYKGRGANTILVTSKDGKISSAKELLLTSEDYPSDLSNHVRDPKVFKKDGIYYMVLGARTKKDEGRVLLYTSGDKRNWKFSHIISKPNFGFMWECPDLFELNGKQFLSLSPQGLESSEYQFQNVYQSGYFRTSGNLLENGTALTQFTEWDMGFDFYAPQTYEDEAGRRILIGWMGVPDVEYDHDPTIEAGWQHMLTLPRELTVESKSGKILQNPVEEILNLRKEVLLDEIDYNGQLYDKIEASDRFELIIDLLGEDFDLVLSDEVMFSYRKELKEMALQFLGKAGYGRDIRKCKMEETEELKHLRIYVDTCCIEIFVNHGEYVFTSKMFLPQNCKRELKLIGQVKNIKLYSLK